MSDFKKLVEEKRSAMLKTLLDSIEKNPVEWEKGWIAIDTPYNGSTGKNYRGLNALFLNGVSRLKGYSDKRWLTFKQAKALGGSIKSGEKSSEVFYWSQYDKKTKKPFNDIVLNGMTLEEQQKYLQENVRAVLQYYNVFNAEQCVNLPEANKYLGMSDEEQTQHNLKIDSIIKNSFAPVLYDGRDRAYYSPLTDSIHLPMIESFLSKNDYYATALHEIAHSTGHSSRLNRNLEAGTFGSAEYAVEELRAELASVFMQTELDINLGKAEIANHGAYLRSWLKVVKKDEGVFFKAASDAGKISDYIRENYLVNARLESRNKSEKEAAAEASKVKSQYVVSEAFIKTLSKDMDYFDAMYTDPLIDRIWEEKPVMRAKIAALGFDFDNVSIDSEEIQSYSEHCAAMLPESILEHYGWDREGVVRSIKDYLPKTQGEQNGPSKALLNSLRNAMGGARPAEGSNTNQNVFVME